MYGESFGASLSPTCHNETESLPGVREVTKPTGIGLDKQTVHATTLIDTHCAGMSVPNKPTAASSFRSGPVCGRTQLGLVQSHLGYSGMEDLTVCLPNRNSGAKFNPGMLVNMRRSTETGIARRSGSVDVYNFLWDTEIEMKNSSMFKVKALFTAVVASTVLSGCYVVPLHQAPGAVNTQQPAMAQPAMRPVYTARLYPTNDSAAALGRVSGTISNPERGHGEFAFTLGNETFSGEATRAPGATKGTANATGSRGSYVKCSYAMSSAQLGTGTCTFANGATYDMHISQ